MKAGFVSTFAFIFAITGAASIVASDIVLYVGVKSGDVQKVKTALYEDANVNLEVANKKLLVEAIDRVLALYPEQESSILDKAWIYLNSLVGNEVGLMHLAGVATGLGCGVSVVRGHALEATLTAVSLTSLIMMKRETAIKNHMEIVEQLAMHPKLSRESLLDAIAHIRERLVKAYEKHTAGSEALLEIDRILRVAASHADAREYRRLKKYDESYR